MKYGKIFLFHSLNNMDYKPTVEGARFFISGVYEWEWVVAVYEVDGGPEAEPVLLGFIDQHGNITKPKHGEYHFHTESEGLHMHSGTKRHKKKEQEQAPQLCVEAATRRWEQHKANDGTKEPEFEIVSVDRILT